MDAYHFDSFNDSSIIDIVGQKQLDAFEGLKSEINETNRKISASKSSSIAAGDLIRPDLSVYEQHDLSALLRDCSDSDLRKRLILFEQLCVCADQLACESARFFPPLYMPFKSISTYLEFLIQLDRFVAKCYLVICVLLRQISSVSEIFLLAFSLIAKLLCFFIKLDLLIRENTFLKQQWLLFKQLLKSQSNAANSDQMRNFEIFLLNLEGKIIDARIFRNAIKKCSLSSDTASTSGSTFEENFNKAMLLLIREAAASGGDSLKSIDKFVGVSGLLLLHFELFRRSNRQVVNDLCSSAPHILPLFGSFHIIIDFIEQNVPSVLNLIDKKDRSYRSEQKVAAQQWLQSFWKGKNEHLRVLRKWFLGACDITSSDLGAFFTHVEEGIRLAERTNYVIMRLFALQSYLSTPMSKSQLLELVELSHCVKRIERCLLTEHFGEIASRLPMQQQLLSRKLLLFVRNQLVAANKSKDELTVSRLRSIELLCSEALSDERLMLIRLLQSSLSTAWIDPEKWRELERLVVAQANALRVTKRIQEATDLSHLWFFRDEMLRVACACSIDKFDLFALEQCLDVFDSFLPGLVQAGRFNATLIDDVSGEIIDYIDREVIDELSNFVEAESRKHIHASLLPPRSPQSISFPHLAILRVLDRYLDIELRIAFTLSRLYYNLNAVALHDSKTYDEMRAHASASGAFGGGIRKFVDARLPFCTIEQSGVDVLEIVKRIDVFAKSFAYNMHQQLFIERSADSTKYLQTLSIQQVSSSVRTHGFGILNTSVNNVYQFLKRRLGAFSQFLRDEKIKSRLTRERKATKNDEIYGYSRGVAVKRSIEQLGAASGDNYLRKFRELITHVGNSLAFVRLIRSGALHCSYEARRFFSPPPDSADLCYDGELLSQLKHAAEACEIADYFRLLVEAFRNILKPNEFFMIIPAMTLEYVDEMIMLRDRNKKLIFDDGFALGLSYLLHVTQQWSDFLSLQWFESVLKHFEAEKTSSSAASQGDGDLRNLTHQRIESFKNEFTLLYFALTSSSIFFQTHSENPPVRGLSKATAPANDDAETASNFSN